MNTIISLRPARRRISRRRVPQFVRDCLAIAFLTALAVGGVFILFGAARP